MNINDLQGKTISLTITNNCNLACIYCYEHNQTTEMMMFEVAKNILDQELTNLKNEKVIIEFFGGEPFLNFELIKKVVEYVRANYEGYYHFFTSTNGTLINKDIQKWLIENKNHFTVGLSLDGNKEAHDINRSNSFDSIDLNFFLDTYPDQTIKMTVSEQSLPYFTDSIIFLTELGFNISCNLAYMIDWSSPKNILEMESQLEKLISYYMAHPEVKKCSMMDFRIDLLSRPPSNLNTIRKQCGCGTHMKCFDIYGVSYPCQLFSPLSAGDKAIPSTDFNVSIDIEKSLLTEECKTCYCQPICQSCLGSNYLSTGNLFNPDMSRCSLYKIIFKANAKLKALEWEQGRIPDNEVQSLLRSIIEINNIN